MVQLEIKFSTPHENYKIDEKKYTLDGNTDQEQLNNIIKKILVDQNKLKEESNIRFDFLIDDELLRSSIIQHVNETLLTDTEHVLDVNFFIKQAQPEHKKSFENNDWIRSLKIKNNLILIGSFDSSVKVWSQKTQNFLFENQNVAHKDAVKQVEWLSVEEDKLQFASCSNDQSILLWQAVPSTQSMKPLICCRGHEEMVNCISLSANNKWLASGSQDKTVKIWSAGVEVTDNDRNQVDPEKLSIKKRKKMELLGYPRQARVELSMQHKDGVSGVKWMTNEHVISASQDHTVKITDVNADHVTRNYGLSLAVNDLDYSQLNRLIATGCMDRHIRLLDTRENVDRIVNKSLTSHHNCVKCVKWSPRNQYQMVSGSHDNYVKTWDIRSTKTALFDIKGHDDYVYAVDWNDDTIVSGGRDKKVIVYSCKDSSQHYIM